MIWTFNIYQKKFKLLLKVNSQRYSCLNILSVLLGNCKTEDVVGVHQGWTGKLFFSRSGAGKLPFPTVRGGAGKGSKSAGWGGDGAGNKLRVSAD